jgi:hypothetical protein
LIGEINPNASNDIVILIFNGDKSTGSQKKY